jgi:hypothetical protein
MKLKKFIPLGTAVLAALTLVSVFFNYFTLVPPAFGEVTGATMGDKGVLSFPEKMNALWPDAINGAISTSAIFYLIALILAVIVIVIAVLNFFGIGGNNMGYGFIGAAVLCFVMALIATIIAYKTDGTLVKYELFPSLAPWWATITSFLAAVSTGNVLIRGGKKRKGK